MALTWPSQVRPALAHLFVRSTFPSASNPTLLLQRISEPKKKTPTNSRIVLIEQTGVVGDNQKKREKEKQGKQRLSTCNVQVCTVLYPPSMLADWLGTLPLTMRMRCDALQLPQGRQFSDATLQIIHEARHAGPVEAQPANLSDPDPVHPLTVLTQTGTSQHQRYILGDSRPILHTDRTFYPVCDIGAQPTTATQIPRLV